MNILFAIWSFFATYILQKAPYMVGFLTLLGYCLMGKKWYDTLGGTLKAIIGMLILNAGSGGLTSNFRPILAGLKDRFGLTAAVIDPYYGQNAVTEGVEEVFGKGFSQAMTLLLIAFIVNIPFQQDHQVPCSVHDRSRTGPAGRYRLLADHVRSSRTAEQQRSPDGCNGCHPGCLLGGWFQPDC